MRFRNSTPHSRSRAVQTDGEQDKYAPGDIEFDMDLKVPDRTIATLGQWSDPSKDKVFSSAGLPQEAKEQEREANVLHRRPSTNTHRCIVAEVVAANIRCARAGAEAQRLVPAPLYLYPHNIYPPQHGANTDLPPLAVFPRLDISLPSPPDAAEIGAPHHAMRSASATAALPASGRVPHVYTKPQVLIQHSPRALPAGPRRIAHRGIPSPGDRKVSTPF